MTTGFNDAQDFAPVIGWELYEVTINKYHVMFYFENAWQLLNVAYAFSHRSTDGVIDYTYEIYGAAKALQVERLILHKIVSVEVRARDQLVLRFDNGDELVILDDPNFCSWWFMPVQDLKRPDHSAGWSMSDDDFGRDT